MHSRGSPCSVFGMRPIRIRFQPILPVAYPCLLQAPGHKSRSRRPVVRKLGRCVSCLDSLIILQPRTFAHLDAGSEGIGNQAERLQKSGFHAPASISLLSGAVRVSVQPRLRAACYGFLGMAPGANRSERSSALAASASSGPTPKISCMVRKSEECVKFTGLAYGTPFTFL